MARCRMSTTVGGLFFIRPQMVQMTKEFPGIPRTKETPRMEQMQIFATDIGRWSSISVGGVILIWINPVVIQGAYSPLHLEQQEGCPLRPSRRWQKSPNSLYTNNTGRSSITVSHPSLLLNLGFPIFERLKPHSYVCSYYERKRRSVLDFQNWKQKLNSLDSDSQEINNSASSRLKN